MAFMQRQIEHGAWWEVETDNDGTYYAPIDVEPEDVAGGHIASVKRITGYGARLSAPGYMDCTDWCVFETEKEAVEYLDEYYPEDEEEGSIEGILKELEHEREQETRASRLI